MTKKKKNILTAEETSSTSLQLFFSSSVLSCSKKKFSLEKKIIPETREADDASRAFGEWWLKPSQNHIYSYRFLLITIFCDQLILRFYSLVYVRICQSRNVPFTRWISISIYLVSIELYSDLVGYFLSVTPLFEVQSL
jgi:hypothetical protein